MTERSLHDEMDTAGLELLRLRRRAADAGLPTVAEMLDHARDALLDADAQLTDLERRGHEAALRA